MALPTAKELREAVKEGKARVVKKPTVEELYEAVKSGKAKVVKEAKEEPDDTGYWGGLARQVARGATFGVSPYIEAGARSLVGPESYSEELEEVTKGMGEFEEQYPKAAIAADIGGSIATGAGLARLGVKAAPAIGRAVMGAGEAALEEARQPGATMGDVATTGAVGGALGALPGSMVAGGLVGAGVGALSDDRSDMLKGAALGAGVTKVAPFLKRNLSKSLKLQKLANEKAVASLGGSVSKMTPQELQGVGEKLFKRGVVKPNKSRAKMLEDLVGQTYVPKNEELMEMVDFSDFMEDGLIGKLSKEVDGIIKKTDSQYLKDYGERYMVKAVDMAENLKTDVLIDETLLPGEKRQYEKIIDGFFSGKEDMNVQQLHALKKKLGKRLSAKNFESETPGKQKVLSDIYIEIKDKIEQSLDDMGQKIGYSPDEGEVNVGQVIKALNQENRRLIQASELAQGGYAKDVAESPLAISMLGGGGLGGAVGAGLGVPTVPSIVAGMTLGAYSKRYGKQVAAAMLNSYKIPRDTRNIIKAADVVQAKIASFAAPEVAKGLEDAIISQNPARIRKAFSEASQLMPELFETTPMKGMDESFDSYFDGKLHSQADVLKYTKMMERFASDGVISQEGMINAIDKIYKSGEVTPLSIEQG